MEKMGEANAREFFDEREREREMWREWEKTRIIKKCKCGQKYSYGYGEDDPGGCLSCRGY